MPVLEPAGTFSMTGPPTVGTRIRPPSTASVERHRQLDMDVVVARLEEGVRLDMDLDIGVARRPALGAGHALALQPQGLAVDRALGDVDVERLAVGQVDPLLAAARRHQERHAQACR